MDQKLNVYQFSFGWQAVFPADWEQVHNEKTKENMFSPPDSDLVFRLSMLHIADKQDNPAPLKVMEEALQQVLPPSNKSLNTAGLTLAASWTAKRTASTISAFVPVTSAKAICLS